jgi:hypothetical protein
VGKKHRPNRALSSHATPPAFLSTPTLTDADNAKDIDNGDSLAVGGHIYKYMRLALKAGVFATVTLFLQAATAVLCFGGCSPLFYFGLKSQLKFHFLLKCILNFKD